MKILRNFWTTHGPMYPADLSELRTIMSADRTLMAWIRTALSMFGFSFTIYKFLQGVTPASGGLHPDAPQHAGMFLAGVGTVAIIFGTIEYWATLHELRKLEHFRLGRPTLVMAILMSVFGIALFVGIWSRAL